MLDFESKIKNEASIYRDVSLDRLVTADSFDEWGVRWHTMSEDDDLGSGISFGGGSPWAEWSNYYVHVSGPHVPNGYQHGGH